MTTRPAVHSQLVANAELVLDRAVPHVMDASRVYAEHGEFVWKSLSRLGVREADLRDMTQEVFIVVHRRLIDRDGSSSTTTWLFGICLRVASAYRRRGYRKYEDLGEDVPDTSDDADSPEVTAAERQGRARLAAILDTMDVEQRAVFVMFEIDEMQGNEIAEVLGCPVGTVFTRLRAARKAFEEALRRINARDASRGKR